MSFGAILLAGGRATRLDGVDKNLLEIAGRSLLQRAIDAVAPAAPVTVVGPARPHVVGAVDWVREDPPFTGPAAAILAALAGWTHDPAHAPAHDPPWTFVLACDLADPAPATALLRAAALQADPETDGICLSDGRPQWLTGVYRTVALRRAATGVPDAGAHASVRALLHDLRLDVQDASEGQTRDIDTWEDVDRAGAHLPADSPAGSREQENP